MASCNLGEQGLCSWLLLEAIQSEAGLLDKVPPLASDLYRHTVLYQWVVRDSLSRGKTHFVTGSPM